MISSNQVLSIYLAACDTYRRSSGLHYIVFENARGWCYDLHYTLSL